MKPDEELERAVDASTAIFNPFAQRLEFTLYDKIKIAVLSVTLFPIRVVVILIFFVAAWLLTKIVLTEKDFLQKPISGWRRNILKKMVHGSLRVAFNAAGFINTPVIGQLASQKEAPILIIAPHSSFFEIIPIVLLGGPSVLAKIETSKVPIYGDFITFSQPVYVQQNDKLSRKQTVSEVRYRAFSEGDWQQIAIFPEGTCTNRTALINFKQGAFYPGVPVQPVCLKYPNRLDTASWTWRGNGVMKNMWLSLCQFRNYCEIHVLPVYKPSKAEIHDSRLFASNVRKVMAKYLDVPGSDWAYSDIRFIRKATDMNIPLSIPVIKLMKLRTYLKIEEESLSGAIKNFEARLKSCSTTDSDFYAFAQLLEFETTDTFYEFFDAIDQNKEGSIDVRSYTCCLWLLRRDVSLTERIQETFMVLADEREKAESDWEQDPSQTELTLPQFSLLLWLILTVPKCHSEKVFKSLDRGTERVKCGDFVKCIESSPGAQNIVNADRTLKVSENRLVCDNEFFEESYGD